MENAPGNTLPVNTFTGSRDVIGSTTFHQMCYANENLSKRNIDVGKYKYVLTPIVANTASGVESKLKPITITINVIDAAVEPAEVKIDKENLSEATKLGLEF